MSCATTEPLVALGVTERYEPQLHVHLEDSSLELIGGAVALVFSLAILLWTWHRVRKNGMGE